MFFGGEMCFNFCLSEVIAGALAMVAFAYGNGALASGRWVPLCQPRGPTLICQKLKKTTSKEHALENLVTYTFLERAV